MFEDIVNATLQAIQEKRTEEINAYQKIDHKVGDFVYFQLYKLQDPSQLEIKKLSGDTFEIKRRQAVGMTSTDECIRAVVTGVGKTSKPTSVVVIDKYLFSTKETVEVYNPSPIYATADNGELVMSSLERGVAKFETYVMVEKEGLKLIGATIACIRPTHQA